MATNTKTSKKAATTAAADSLFLCHGHVTSTSTTAVAKYLSMSDRRPPVVIPSSDHFVSRESVDSFMHGIRAAAIQFVPSFAALSAADEDALKVEQLSGGITNALFKVFQPDAEGKPLDGNSALVRIFGDKTELVIDRVREEALMDQLLAYQVGTPLYGRFANGRVEHFLPGRSLTPDDMTDPTLTPLIASALAHVHSIDLQDWTPPSAFNTIENWLQTEVLSIRFDDEPERAAILETINVKAIADEVASMKHLLLEKMPAPPVVFCHNDLLSGNIMLHEKPDSSDVFLIDFEYSCNNFREFDIGNHFNECCGFDCDWNKFPSREQQCTFLCAYLARSKNCALAEVSEADIDAIYRSTQPWVLVSHLFWGVWAVFQAKHAKIDFDFLNYSKLRFQGYYLLKERCLAAAGL